MPSLKGGVSQAAGKSLKVINFDRRIAESVWQSSFVACITAIESTEVASCRLLLVNSR